MRGWMEHSCSVHFGNTSEAREITASATISATLTNWVTWIFWSITELDQDHSYSHYITTLILSHHTLSGATSIVIFMEVGAVVDAVEHLVLELLVIVGQQDRWHSCVMLQYGLGWARRHGPLKQEVLRCFTECLRFTLVESWTLSLWLFALSCPLTWY